MDIRFDKDGPVTFGALGGTYPQMNAQAGEFAVVSGIVRNGVLGPAAGDIVRPDNAASVKITMNDTGATYSADSGILGDPVHRFGPVLNEYHKTVPLTNHIAARWAIRKFVGFDTPVVDLTIENCWAYEPGPQNFKYDVEVTIDGKVVFSGPALTHLHHGRWRMVFNDFGVEATFPWLGTEAVPYYDPTMPPSESTLQKMAAVALNAGPMKTGATTGQMPATGGRDDIGLLPAWQVNWLLSGDARARDATLVSADGAGSFSIHYRDKNTDRPISLVDFPYMTIDGRSTDTVNPKTGKPEAFPALDANSATPYTADTAHHPGLSYLPYLMTGDYYHLEELQFWAMYNLFKSNPGYRGNVAGWVISEQLRGQAWALRTLAQAAYITPDADPLKPGLLQFMESNLDWYNNAYTNNPVRSDTSPGDSDFNPAKMGNDLGAIVNGYTVAYDGGIGTAPWMDDFFTSVIGYCADLGFKKALPLLEWKAKFTVGRMTAPGVCWVTAAPYALYIRPTANGPFYKTLAECYTHELGEMFMALPCASPAMAAAWNIKGYPSNQYPSDKILAGDMSNIAFGNMGYPSNMQPALAYCAKYDVKDGRRAWDLFMSRSVKPDYGPGAQFNVVPKNYTAQPVPPYVDTDTRKWDQIGKEGDTVTVPTDTTVRYGANGLYVERVCSGPVVVSNTTFGTDPAPNVPKILQQLIPQPPEGNTVTYTVLLVPTTGPVELPAGSESTPTSTIAEILAADKTTVLATSGVAPYSFPGISAGDRTWRLTDYDSKGAIMGKAVTGAFTLPDDTVVTPPVDTTPVTATLTTGATVSWTKD